ncbi:hypothetical protein FHR85_001992 [Alkalibacillus almallahensis]|nr:hypothetical protein [Alkalibacillus almallahensis]
MENRLEYDFCVNVQNEINYQANIQTEGYI